MQVKEERKSLSREKRIIMGTDTTLGEQELSRTRKKFWTAEREEDFLQQVSLKAQAKAREIIQDAMQEAETIRGQAHKQGLDQAQKDIKKQIQQTKDSLKKQFQQVTESLEKEKHKIFEDYSQDLMLLNKCAIEKILNLELNENRELSLRNLLEEGLESIDTLKGLTLKIHPQDAELLEDLLKQAQTQFPALERWRIKKDKTIDPGGLFLETQNGMVDNSLSTRRSEIMAILENLSLDI